MVQSVDVPATACLLFIMFHLAGPDLSFGFSAATESLSRRRRGMPATGAEVEEVR